MAVMDTDYLCLRSSFFEALFTNDNFKEAQLRYVIRSSALGLGL